MAVGTEADVYLLRVKQMSQIIMQRNKDLLYLDGGYKDVSAHGDSEDFNSQVLTLENEFRKQTVNFNKTMEAFDKLTFPELVDLDKQLTEILLQLEIPLDVLETTSVLNQGGYTITSSAGSIIAVGKSVTYRLVEVSPHISSADSKYEYRWYCENDVLTRDNYPQKSSTIETVVERDGISNWFDAVFGDPTDITIKAGYPGIHDIKVDIILNNKLLTTAVFRQTVLESIDQDADAGNDPTKWKNMDEYYKQKYPRTNKWDVYAIKSGTVEISMTGENQSASYGNTLVIRDNEIGKTARYGHLASTNLNVGDIVTEGQTIGVMGDTGNGVPGPCKHLHVSVYPSEVTSGWHGNQAENPYDYIASGTYPSNTKVSNLWGSEATGMSSGAHEGVDTSGLDVKIISNWQRGVSGEKVHQYVEELENLE